MIDKCSIFVKYRYYKLEKRTYLKNYSLFCKSKENTDIERYANIIFRTTNC